MGSFDAWVNNGGGSHVDVPVYTQATLPSPTVGLIVKLSDFNRGLWYANGTTWLPVGNEIIFNPIDFGADATGVLDSSTAINLAITSMSGVTFDSVGYTLGFSPGIYRLSAPIDVVRRLRMTTYGPAATNSDAPAAYLKPDVGITAIIVHFPNDGSADGGSGAGSVIENLTISGTQAATWTASTVIALNSYVKPTAYSQYVFKATARSGDFKTGAVQPTWPALAFVADGASVGTTTTDNHVTWTTAHQTAIWLRASAHINNVSVFAISGDGVEVVASTSLVPSTNANGSSISQLYLEQTNGNGLYIAGADANACDFSGVSANSFKGWGVWDSSFLGNHHTAHQVASAVAVGAYKSDNTNARNVFDGCYAESGTGAASIKSPAIFIGGLPDGFTSDTDALLLYNNSLQSFTTLNNDGVSYVRSSLGGPDGSNTAYTAFGAQAENSSAAVINGTQLRLKFAQAGYGAGFWGMDLVNNLDYAFAIATNQQAVYPNATLLAVQGIGLGNPGENVNSLVRMYTGAAAPTTGAHVVNEMVFNNAPSADSPLVWRCVTAGTPGTWEACYAGAEHRLASALIDLSLSTKQNLFTVPAGRSCIVTYVNSRGPSATITTAAGGIGYNAGGTDVAVLSMPTTTATYQITGFTALVGTIGAAAAVLGFKTTATQAATTMTLDVFGYLF